MTTGKKSPLVPRTLLAAAQELTRAVEASRSQRVAIEEQEARASLRRDEQALAKEGPLRRRARASFRAWLDASVARRLPLLELTRGERIVYARARILELPSRLPDSGLTMAVRIVRGQGPKHAQLQFGRDDHAQDLSCLGAQDLTFVADYFSSPAVWADLNTLIDQRMAAM